MGPANFVGAIMRIVHLVAFEVELVSVLTGGPVPVASIVLVDFEPSAARAVLQARRRGMRRNTFASLHL